MASSSRGHAHVITEVRSCRKRISANSARATRTVSCAARRAFGEDRWADGNSGVLLAEDGLWIGGRPRTLPGMPHGSKGTHSLKGRKDRFLLVPRHGVVVSSSGAGSADQPSGHAAALGAARARYAAESSLRRPATMDSSLD